MSYHTHIEKEAYKAGLKKGQTMVMYAGIGGNSDQTTQTERLIKAINDLTSEVKDATALRNKVHGIKAAPKPKKLPWATIQQAVKDLQIALGTTADGLLTPTQLKLLFNEGLTYGFHRGTSDEIPF